MRKESPELAASSKHSRVAPSRTRLSEKRHRKLWHREHWRRASVYSTDRGSLAAPGPLRSGRVEKRRLELKKDAEEEKVVKVIYSEENLVAERWKVCEKLGKSFEAKRACWKA